MNMVCTTAMSGPITNTAGTPLVCAQCGYVGLTAQETFQEMPLSASPLSDREREILLLRLDDLVRFLGAPGDWGYQSKLGRWAQRLHALRNEVANAKTKQAQP